jgi:hypothetical protein
MLRKCVSNFLLFPKLCRQSRSLQWYTHPKHTKSYPVQLRSPTYINIQRNLESSKGQLDRQVELTVDFLDAVFERYAAIMVAE